LGNVGVNQFKGGDKTKNITSSKERGTSAQYRIAKLKRDHPEIAERYEQSNTRTSHANGY